MGLVKELSMLRSVDLSDYMLHKPFKVAISDNIFVAIDIIIENKVSCSVYLFSGHQFLV